MAQIDIAPDGPFLVKGLKKLTDSQGNTLEEKESHALCRCGLSKNKPFCDGAHKAAGWSGAKERTEKYDTYEFEGKDVTVVDNIGICCHDGACVRGSKKAFFSWDGPKRISNPDDEEKQIIIDTIRKCPSGSLAYKLDGKLYDEYFNEEEIFIAKNGPLMVRGGVVLNDPSSEELISKEHYTLCRCGASKNKPFCDGKHKKVEFSDENL